jgi:guanylate kinase
MQKKQRFNLQSCLLEIDTETLKRLQSDIADVSIAISMGGNCKPMLERRIANASTKREKIVYKAIKKAKPHELQAMADIFVKLIK